MAKKHYEVRVRQYKNLGSIALLTTGLLAILSLQPHPSSAVIQNGKIVFYSDLALSGAFHTYVMNADGSGLTDLTNLTCSNPDPAVCGAETDPTWYPDGSKIAFVSGRGGTNANIYVMNADGTGAVRLTNNSSYDYSPSWSPDGGRIIFDSDRNDPGGNEELYVMNADGSGQSRLTNNSARDIQPAWSPGGTKIAFRTYRDGNWEIYSMNTDGTGQTRLTANAVLDRGAAWSPGGTQIAFSSTRDSVSDNDDVYIMNADGSNVRRLTSNPQIDDDPEWSPDGNKIVFASTRLSFNHDIFVMNADGTGQTALTNNAANNFSPDWQPIVVPDASTPAPAPATTTTTTPPPSAGEGRASFGLATPNLSTDRVNKMRRGTLYRYIRSGFKGTYSSYDRVEASLVRVVTRKSKKKGLRSADITGGAKRCYRINRPGDRISCSLTSTKGVTMSSSGSSAFIYRPFGSGVRAKRAMHALILGRHLRKGMYVLTFNPRKIAGNISDRLSYSIRAV